MAFGFNTRAWFIVALLVASAALQLQDVGAAGGGGGVCGRTPIRSAAVSLTPCLGSAKNPRARVPPVCCSKVGALIRSDPRCLCAVLLSPLAKQAGINPGVAISIPKRCNIRNRPVGKKCGKYTVP